jgi:hypothetical protein
MAITITGGATISGGATIGTGGGGGDTRPTLNNFVPGPVFTPSGGTPTITDNTSYYTVTSPSGNTNGSNYYFPDNVAKTSGKWYYFMTEVNNKFRPVLIKEAADDLGTYYLATDTTYVGGTTGTNIIYIDIDNGELYVDKLDGTNTHSKTFSEPAGRRFYPGVSVENGTGVGEISFTSSYATPTSIRSGYSLWRG